MTSQDEDEKRVLITGATALVSGATGFLGGYLAEMLQERGYRVRALARETSDLGRLKALGVEIVIGELSDPASLRRETEGQSLVFHTAGKVTDWGKKEEFFHANRDGTRNIIRACQPTRPHPLTPTPRARSPAKSWFERSTAARACKRR